MEPDFRAEAREKWRINELRRIGRGEATVSRSSLTDTGGSWLDRRLEKEDKEEQPKVAIKNGKTEDVSDEDRSILPTEKAPSRPRWIDRMLPENYQSDANYLSDRIEEEVAKVSHEDGLPSSPLLRRLPASLLPYAALARLDKPIGTYLLLHPCLWSAALAGSPALVAAAPPFLSSAAPASVAGIVLPSFAAGGLSLPLAALFATGAVVMRGAGCTINDLWDREYDRSVVRTRTRPLASGALAPPQAAAFLGLQLSLGLGVLLSVPHGDLVFPLAAASLPLVACYPLAKRFTDYPQLVLGLTFNWGAMVGFAAAAGVLDLHVAGPLYGAGVCWTMVYDTLYAHQDKNDDATLGLRSTALTFGEETKPILYRWTAGFYAALCAAGYGTGYDGALYYLGCTAATGHLLWQVQSANLNDPDNLAYRFKSNNVTGLLVLGSIMAGNITTSL